MKVQIRQLKPNPFRDIEHYPIDRFKVESLVASIKNTGFWDNILARKNGDGYQLAYGHHRHEALKQVFGPDDYIDIPVKDLDDVTMIRIMANENIEQWGRNVDVVFETIKAVKKYLDDELAKYDKWEDVPKGCVISRNLKDSNVFNNVKTKGIGYRTIWEFLGDPWTENMVRDHMEIITDKEIDDETVKIFDNITQVRNFKRAINKINKDKPDTIPIDKQIDLAQLVKDRIDNKNIALGAGGEQNKSMETIIIQELDGVDEFDSTLKDLEIDLKRIEAETRKLTTSILTMNGRLYELGVEKLQSMRVIFAVQELSSLSDAVKTLSQYFGYSPKQIEND